MTLTEIDVEHISKLALLALTPEEIECYQEQLSAILAYAKTLQEVDTSDIPSTYSVSESRAVLREDVWDPCDDINGILLNMPDIMDNQVRISDRSNDE